MKQSRSWRAWLAPLMVCVALTACGGGRTAQDVPPPVEELPSEVPNEVLRSPLTAGAGARLSVPASAAGVAGTLIEIPPDAAIDDLQVQVGYENAPPGPFRAEAIAAGALAVSKTLVLKAAGGGPAQFNLPITVTMPYDLAAAGDLPPAVLYWDEAANRYRTVSVIAVDRNKGMVTFRTSHFSRFMAIIVRALGLGMPAFDTGFRLGTDSILHRNFGSYLYGGHCAAFASLSTHYFSLDKTKRLYALSNEGMQGQPVDDELTRTALAMTHAVIVGKWNSVVSSILIPQAIDTGRLMLESMIATGDPLHLVMHSGTKDGGHSVTVFAYDADQARFRIYDSNAPDVEASYDWNKLTGFGTYSRAASYPPSMFEHIGYASDDTFGAPAQFQKIIGEWESGKLQDYFSHLQVTDQQGKVQALDYARPVRVQIAYQNGQSLQGRFNRPAGSSKPVYLHVFYDGVRQGATGVPLDAAGNYTLNFPTRLEHKIDVMLLVSEHARSTEHGFSAFGKFSVQPAGENFFVNFGFESGDLSGWNSQTSLLDTGGVFTPTKIEVVGVGFDPIATDLTTSIFGMHAARINDQTPGYHTTYVAQKAVVPAAASNPQLVFQWAAVLEDPRHDPSEQPYVDVVVRNLSKGVDLYRRRFFTSDPSFQGWKDYQGGGWKAIPWQPVILSGLGASAGDEIELRITGADCSLGGHGGYVYLDGEE